MGESKKHAISATAERRRLLFFEEWPDDACLQPHMTPGSQQSAVRSPPTDTAHTNPRVPTAVGIPTPEVRSLPPEAARPRLWIY
jgi:hypothetical protein